ncbi:hypothetical protein ATANTOWER_008637, partial [Ataeniobius toweri]|nr:hypothetical protein [Ataeniobius toweri]
RLSASWFQPTTNPDTYRCCQDSQCLSVCLCGDLRSKPQSSCNSQPKLQVPALHPAKVKFPGSQGIYLDQVLADSSKPLSFSKRTLLTLHLITIHFQLLKTSPDSAAVSPLSQAPHHPVSSNSPPSTLSQSLRSFSICFLNI